MEKKKIQFGIIGCSQIAFSSTIPAILNSKFSDLKIIGSRNPSRAEEFAIHFNCNQHGTYEEVIENKEIDAVYISTPIGTHKEWVIKAAKKGIHILCEKSISNSLESTKKMLEQTKKNKVKLMEGLMFRFHPSHKKVQDIIHRKKLGKIFSFYGEYGFPAISKKNIRYNKKLGGGIINDAACYPICASRIIFEKEPKHVFCINQVDKKNKVDERTSISLVFDNQNIAQMECGYNLNYSNFYSIWGEKGSIHLSRAYNIPPDMKPILTLNTQQVQKQLKINTDNHFELMFNHFSSEILQKRRIAFNFEQDIMNQAKVLEAIRISARKKQIIEVSSIK